MYATVDKEKFRELTPPAQDEVLARFADFLLTQNLSHRD